MTDVRLLKYSDRRDDRQYRVRLENDREVVGFIIWASSARSAAERMLKLEHAPVGALLSVEAL